MYTLYIANKNYSSWSLRPWVLMQELGIGFDERLLPFGEQVAWEGFRRISPSGKVPCLVDGALSVWDSLSIVEYLAERHPGVWPRDPQVRAWARSAAAEMHSGFMQLRQRCSMSCGVRVRLAGRSAELECDLVRMRQLWEDGLGRFGGPFLSGSAFGAVDAFFAPVAFRVQTYGLELGPIAAEYVARLLDLGSMRRWYRAALQEPQRDPGHDSAISQRGEIIADLRVATTTG